MSLSGGGSVRSGCGLPRENTQVFHPGSLNHMVRKANSTREGAQTMPRPVQPWPLPQLILHGSQRHVVPSWSPLDQTEVTGKGWPVTSHPVYPVPPILSEYWTSRLCFLIWAELKAPRKRLFVCCCHLYWKLRLAGGQFKATETHRQAD